MTAMIDSDPSEADEVTRRLKALLRAYIHATLANTREHLQVFAPLVAQIAEEDRLYRIMACITSVYAMPVKSVEEVDARAPRYLGRLYTQIQALTGQMINHLTDEHPTQVIQILEQLLVLIVLAQLIAQAGVEPDFAATWVDTSCIA